MRAAAGADDQAAPFGLRAATVHIGAEVEGLDVHRLLAGGEDATIAALRAAVDRHIVLRLRDVTLDPDQLIRFGGRLGKVRTDRFGPEVEREIFVLSNAVDSAGAPIGAFGCEAQVWHTDASFCARPNAMVLMYVTKAPAKPPKTYFMSAYGAYERLPSALKAEIAALSGMHSVHNISVLFAAHMDGASAPPEQRRDGFWHPLVRLHPTTRRPFLFLPRRRDAPIYGLGPVESRLLLERLWAAVYSSTDIWAVGLTAGDLLIVDNRVALHRRDGWNQADERVLLHIAIEGEVPLPAHPELYRAGDAAPAPSTGNATPHAGRRSAFTVRTASPGLGAEVEGLDASALLGGGAPAALALREALDRHLVLCARGVTLDPAQLVALGRLLGPVRADRNVGEGIAPAAQREIRVLSNAHDAAGAPLGELGNDAQVWHTDAGHRVTPNSYVLMHVAQAPDPPPRNFFLSAYGVYESLPADLKAEIAGRCAIHSPHGRSVQLRDLMEGAAVAIEKRREGPRHPLVRLHPSTRRPFLYLPRRRDAAVEGMDAGQSRLLMERLWAALFGATTAWAVALRAGDLLIFDNRVAIHAREGWKREHARVVHHLAVDGEVPLAAFPELHASTRAPPLR